MTCARYVQIVEQQLHALLGLDGDQLLIVVERKLPREAQQALAGFAPQLVQYFLTGLDRDLNVGSQHRTLRELGLMQLSTGDWTHPLGDEVGDQILAGVLRLPDSPRTSREREVLTGRRRPVRKTRIKAERIGPGHYRWTEPKGVWVDPVFNDRRLF